MAPGADSGRYLGFYRAVRNESGQIVFYAQTKNSEGLTSEALYSGLAGEIIPLARHGTVVRGAPDPISYVNVPNTLEINAAGRTAFGANFENDGGAHESIVVGARGSLTIAAQPGMPAPGRPSGVKFSYLSVYSLRMFQEQILFQATDDSAEEVTGLYAGPVVARTGAHAPGTPAGVFYDSPSGEGIYSSGTVAFFAGLKGTGIRQGKNDVGLWAGNAGSRATRNPSRHASSWDGTRGDVPGI